MERSYLPEGSGGEEPPEEPSAIQDEAALEAYEERMAAFERSLPFVGTSRRRRRMSDYTVKNCEECVASRWSS